MEKHKFYIVADYYFYYKVISNKAGQESVSKIKWF